MGVFISWSEKGSQSHEVAKLLKEWLPRVIQKLPCFLSSHDIVAGASWLPELFSRLEESNLGIVCLTRASMARPWLTFEAGAIAKRLGEAKVCPLLIDLEKSDVEFPLAAFQLVNTSKEDIRRLLDTVNTAFPQLTLPKDELDEVFEIRWPTFEQRLETILKSAAKTQKPKPRGQAEIMEELLSLTRGIASGKIAVNTSTTEVSLPMRELVSIDDRPLHRSAALILQFIFSKVRKERPLISGWVESAVGADVDGTDFNVFFPKDGSMAIEAMKRPNNAKYLQDALAFACNELKLAPLRFVPRMI